MLPSAFRFYKEKACRRAAVSVNHAVCTFAIRDTALLSLDELLDEGKTLSASDLIYATQAFHLSASALRANNRGSTMKSEVLGKKIARAKERTGRREK